jgi:2-methylcitrate dehydratase
MVAVPLIFGRLTADDYTDAVAADPRIDALRAKMTVRENPQFTKDYFDPDKRYIGNSVQVFFKDGSKTDKITIDYPIGHRRRRAEGIPVLLEKFRNALGHLPETQALEIVELCGEPTRMLATPVPTFMGLFALEPHA